MKPVNILRYFAPLFFIMIAGIRCYLETTLFSQVNEFSYYTLLHHVLWYIATMLGIMLTLHFLLKISFKSLNWLFYSAILFFIPIIYASLTGENLQLEYLAPDLLNILKSSLSACLLNPANKAQFLEIVLIDSGILIGTFLKTKNLQKAIITTLAVHFVLTLFGIKWFYSKTGSPGIIYIATNLSNHVWLSLIWLICSTFLVQIILFRTVIDKKNMVKGIITGLLVWAVIFVSLKICHGKITAFDAAAVTLPGYTTGFICFLYYKLKGMKIHSSLYIILFAILVFQLMAVLPIFFNIQQSLINKPVTIPF